MTRLTETNTFISLNLRLFQRDGGINASTYVSLVKPTGSNRFRLCVELDNLLTIWPKITEFRATGPTERKQGYRNGNRYVNANLPHIDKLLKAVCSAAGTSKNCRAVSVRISVNKFNCFIKSVNIHHTQNRTKYLLLVDRHVWRYVAENRWPNKISAFIVSNFRNPAIENQVSTLICALLNQTIDPIQSRL